MSSTNEKKPSGYRSLSPAALVAALALALAVTACFEDRSLGTIGDGGQGGAGGGGGGGAPGATCAARATDVACQALSGCRWLEPGCGAPALPRATCAALAELDCRGDAACPTGKRCLSYSTNPCPGPTSPGQATCGACGQETRLCW